MILKEFWQFSKHFGASVTWWGLALFKAGPSKGALTHNEAFSWHQYFAIALKSKPYTNNCDWPFDLHISGSSVNNPTTLYKFGEWVTHMAGHKNMVLSVEKTRKVVNFTFCACRPPALQ